MPDRQRVFYKEKKMKVNVEINSKQIFEEQEESEKNICQGEITYHNNGTVLEFTEKYEEQELKFKMTILEGKVITYRNGQPMIFDKSKTTKSSISTQYGNIDMNVKTNNIDIKKENDKIRSILLEYDIEIENQMEYKNRVEILIK